MDLSNLINTEIQPTVKNQFNSAQLNMQNISEDQLVDICENNICNCNQKLATQEHENLLKDMFNLLANSNDVSYVLNELRKKYGSLVDQKIITACMKFIDLIGNYIITCKYNDNLGSKQQGMVKYVMLCDCDDSDCIQTQLHQGGIDGFFTDPKKVVLSKQKICKKHNLPVLAKIQDLSEDDFNALAKKVAQVKNVQLKDNKKANVATRIAKLFNLAHTKVYAKQDSSKYYIKQANTDLRADVSKKQQITEITDASTPKQDKVAVSKKIVSQKVNMPIKNVNISVKAKQESMKPFTVKSSKYNDIKLAQEYNKDVVLPSKNINVAVDKQSKFVTNICLKTEPVDEGFEMKDDFSFDIPQQNSDNITIDTKNTFDF